MREPPGTIFGAFEECDSKFESGTHHLSGNFPGEYIHLKNIQGQLPRLEGGYSFLRDRVAQIQAGMDQNQDLIQNQIDTMKSDLDTWYSEWLQEKNSTIALSTKMQALEALPLRVQTLECQAKAQSSQLSEVFQTVQNLLAQDRHQGPVSSPQYLEILDQIKVLNNKVETLQINVRVLSCNPPPIVLTPSCLLNSMSSRLRLTICW